MQARQLSIGDTLHERNPYHIPKYQRAYAWRDEHIDDFIRDLRECWREVNSGHNRNHFFGGIVTLKVDDNTVIGHHYKVIDGQQRLATFTILISLIERAYIELSEIVKAAGDENISATCQQRADTLRSDFLTYNGEKDGRPCILSRLELSRRDIRLFPELINHRDPEVDNRDSLSHKNLKYAYDTIRSDLVNEIINNLDDYSEKITRLENLKKVALDHSLIIHITGDNEEEGNRLFQVINDRGAGLTDGDLLRSRSLELLESYDTHQELAEEAWDELLAEEISTVDHFLKVFYSSRKSERPRKSNLFDDFANAFLDYQIPINTEMADNILDLVQEVETERSVFLNVLAGEWPYELIDSRISEWDRNRLKLLMSGLNHTLCIPLLLAAVKLEQTTFSDLVNLLERFVFRYVIVCDRHVGTLSKVYLEHSVLIRDNPETYSIANLKTRLNQLQNEDASDSLFKADLPEKIYYKRGGNKTLKYFLTTVEDYLRWAKESEQGEPRCFDKSRVFDLSHTTIEHIYPQRARSTNRNDQLEQCKHKLGNLSFWSSHDNSRSGNNPFHEKKVRYNNSNVGLNTELYQLDEWDIQQFNDRNNRLVKYATIIFSA